MTEDGIVDFVSKGDFDEVTAVGLVAQDSFVSLYERLFHTRRGQEVVRVLVNILDFQGQLSFESFTRILQHADAHEIGYIDMTVITQDPGRPLIGQMLEALADGFNVNVKLTFSPHMPERFLCGESA
ncbi:hypothetical protein [Terasakiella pusilla]|jgi:hypothetical protein|uniref:hypothetical protein n=1 Tax=Terasakiella pusilla TaxID=64973 RepID=UPI00048B6204|nr:hypothetical protein [Terasakiella pusilla]